MTTKLNLRLYSVVGVALYSPSRVEHLALRAHRCISAAAAGDGSGLTGPAADDRGYLAAAASRFSLWWHGDRRPPALTADTASGAGLHAFQRDVAATAAKGVDPVSIKQYFGSWVSQSRRIASARRLAARVRHARIEPVFDMWRMRAELGYNLRKASRQVY